MLKALYTKPYIHHRVWCQSAILQKMKQQTERHGQRDFQWACIVQQMFQQLTSQQFALQALQQQHPGCQKQISQRQLENCEKRGRLYHWNNHQNFQYLIINYSIEVLKTMFKHTHLHLNNTIKTGKTIK